MLSKTMFMLESQEAKRIKTFENYVAAEGLVREKKNEKNIGYGQLLLGHLEGRPLHDF